MALSDATVRSAKPTDKAFTIYDERGLFLQVSPSGAKLWRLKYSFGGLRKLLALGRYPETGLKDARTKRDEARELLAKGIDPSVDKKRKKVAADIANATTFKAVADEYMDKIEREGIAQATRKKTRWLASQLEKDIGSLPIADIEPYEVLAALKKIELRGNHETAKRVRSFASRVFTYAVITSRARLDPAASLGGALITPKVKNHAAIVDAKGVGGLLKAIEGYEGYRTTKLALKVIAHLFVRPGELRHAEWPEFDFEAKVWRIPAAKTKMRSEHVVPLSSQVLDMLIDVNGLTGGGRYVFPSVRSGNIPMSENTLNAALRGMGYGQDQMTSHGFRSTASTLLNESGKWSSDAIERALAHKDSNKIRGTYHRGTHWDERVKMAQWWSDYLEMLRDGGKVIALRRGA